MRAREPRLSPRNIAWNISLGTYAPARRLRTRTSSGSFSPEPSAPLPRTLQPPHRQRRAVEHRDRRHAVVLQHPNQMQAVVDMPRGRLHRCRRSGQCRCPVDPPRRARLPPGPTATSDGGTYLSGGELEGARKGATVQPRKGVDGQRFPAELLYVAEPAWAASSHNRAPCWRPRPPQHLQPRRGRDVRASRGAALERSASPQLVQRQGSAQALDAHL